MKADPYLGAMVNRVQCDQALSKRKPSPMMNRGYFARVECINELSRKSIDSLLAGNGEQMEEVAEVDYQIVNLGCGFDTSSLRKIKEETSSGERSFHVFEVDLAEVVTQKAGILSAEEGLMVSKVGERDFRLSVQGDSSSSSSVRLLGSDLKDADAVCRSLTEAGINLGTPTLIITECVMVYMDKDSCQKLCRSLGQMFRGPAAWITYDMVGVGDVFGQMMLKNLTNAGYNLPGFVDNPTKGEHVELFTASGWNEASCRTMLESYRELISPEDKARVAKLEIFDEIEEWEMLMSHYCLTVAHK
jgi:tRNA wybutosine-synthesizing protein 4